VQRLSGLHRGFRWHWYSVKLQNEPEPQPVLAASAELEGDYLVLREEDGRLRRCFCAARFIRNPLPATCPGGGMADAEDLKS
jgi:hypothetical protein